MHKHSCTARSHLVDEFIPQTHAVKLRTVRHGRTIPYLWRAREVVDDVGLGPAVRLVRVDERRRLLVRAREASRFAQCGLLLLPVHLRRRSGRSRFRVKFFFRGVGERNSKPRHLRGEDWGVGRQGVFMAFFVRV